MRNIFIESSYFNLNSRYAKYLISSLKKLSFAGYTILFDKSALKGKEYLKSVFKGEDIKYKVTSNCKGAVIIGKGYRNLEEAVKNISFGRSAEINRKTNETEIKIKLDIDGIGKSEINTGIGFFDHMLEQIARHANINLEVKVKGDLKVDEHHTVEDTGIVLGQALAQALGDKKGIQRYGFFTPMDESASVCSIDLSGRSYLNYSCEFKRDYVGGFPVELTEEFFRALSSGLKANIFIKAKGKNDHHKIESIFKAFAKSLNEACRFDERNNNRVPSTKGIL
jgi:imidazoleglycerol-phosphate dehydratase / histidinol-phosphatase